MGGGCGECAASVCRQVLMRGAGHRWETGRLEASGIAGGSPVILSCLLSYCAHTPHPASPSGVARGTQPLPCPGSWCRTCSLPGQTDVSSPHSGQRLLAHFLSPPAPPRTQTFLSPGQTDCSLPQDGPLADLPFLCLASCFLLHYVQFVSAGLME